MQTVLEFHRLKTLLETTFHFLPNNIIYAHTGVRPFVFQHTYNFMSSNCMHILLIALATAFGPGPMYFVRRHEKQIAYYSTYIVCLIYW